MISYKYGTQLNQRIGYGVAEAVTPSDTVALANKAKALYVGGTGDISVVMDNGATVTFTGVPAGSVLPITITQVNATNTTATGMVALS